MIGTMSQLTIGEVTLENNVILAPMAGVTDLPFRLLCREQGAGLLCMEMVSAKAILYRNKNTEKLMEIDQREMPVSLQLFGSEPDVIAKAAAEIEDRPFAILDINMGCPVPKIVNNGEGSALMKNPRLAAGIVRETAKAISKPVTVKIRKGYDEAHCNAVELAKYLEDAGAAAITVHGRTREQFYSGAADLEIIRKVKEAVAIPVIGNGDVADGESAKRMLEETGCDGIMVGRAAQGNPWIFREITSYLEHGVKMKRPAIEEVRDMIRRHAALQLECKGDYIGIREMRKHVAWYIAGYPHAASLRKKVCSVERMEELMELLGEIGR